MEVQKRKKDFTGVLALTIVRLMFLTLVVILLLLLGKIFIEGIGVITPEFLLDEQPALFS